MKLYLLIVVLFCSVLMGVCISKYFHARQRFFRSLCNFCENLNLKISYSKTKLEDIIKNNMQIESQEFSIFIKQYLLFLSGEITRKTFLEIKIRFLSNQENADILNFFATLGEMAKDEEIEKISFYKKIFEKYADESEKSAKKFSSLYFKLCIILGLFLIVIFI